jgi:hypothetical protein
MSPQAPPVPKGPQACTLPDLDVLPDVVVLIVRRERAVFVFWFDVFPACGVSSSLLLFQRHALFGADITSAETGAARRICIAGGRLTE